MAKAYVPFTVPTIAVRQVAAESAWEASGSNPITFGSNVASTEAVLALVWTSGSDSPGLSGCGISTWTQIGSTEAGAPDATAFLGINSAGGSKTLTVTAPTTNQWAGIALDISGPLVGTPVQTTIVTETWSGSGASTQSAPTFNPTQVGDLMVALMVASTGSTIDAPSGWTTGNPVGGLFYAYRLATSGDVASGAVATWSTPASIYVPVAMLSVVLR